MDATSKLIHLDISGMNFGVEQLEELCPILATCDNLQALHLSDNNIREDTELTESVQSMFGISEENFIKKPIFTLNLETQNPKKMEDSIKSKLNLIHSDQVLKDDMPISAKTYKDHYVLATQLK